MNEPALPSDKRLPSLDGWRAVSIALVLASHSSITRGFPPRWVIPFKWLFDGNLGVRCFFLISGLLITWLLLEEFARKGSLNLRNFYVRRAIRILPAYWAFLAVVAVISLFTPFKQPGASWVRNLTFTTNFGAGTWTTGHLWSLAVEEQFYLIWPFVLLFLLRAKGGRLLYIFALLTVFATAAVSRTVGYMMHHDMSINPALAASSFFNYWDTIATGCSLAFVMTKRPAWLVVMRTRPLAWMLTAAFLILPSYVLERLFILGIFTIPLGPILQALGLGMLVLQSITEPQLFCYRLLNTPFLKAVGVLSYSIYLWQEIFCTTASTFGISSAWWPGFPLWLLPALLTGYLSYHWLEAPLLKLRRRFRDVGHGDEKLPVVQPA